MARTTSKSTEPAKMTLEQLEDLNEAANVRRGELVEERKRLERLEETGEPVAKELRRIRRDLEALEDHVDEFAPALRDARQVQATRIRNAGRIAHLERQVAVFEDLLAAQEAIKAVVAERIEPHLNLAGRGADVPERFSRLARDFRPGGQMNLNGEAWTVPAQVQTTLTQARRELEQLRAEAQSHD